MTPNRWWPIPSPDGRYVAAGNRAVWVLDRLTGIETAIPLSGVAYPHGWYGSDTLLCTEIIGEGRRRVWFCSAPDWQPRLMINIDPTIAAGFEVRASGGHWSTFTAQGLTWDGAPLMREGQRVAGHGIRQNGPWLATRDPAQSYCVAVYRDGVWVRDVPKLAEVYDWDIGPDGTVAYGYGPVRVSTPDGMDSDAAVTPGWGEGQASGGIRLVTGPNQVRWLWTVTRQGAWVIGRPIGSQAVIEVPIAAAWFTAACTGAEWVIAASDDVGRMTIASVPVDAPRVILTNPGPTEPVLDTSGQPIDMLPFFVGGEWPHTSKPNDESGTIDLIVNEPGKPKTLQFVKWQNPQAVECYRYDDLMIYHHSDATDPASNDCTQPYHFTDGRWVARMAKVGDVIDCPANVQQRFDAMGFVIKRGVLAYRMTVEAHYLSFDCGGDIGVREVVRLKYDCARGGTGDYERQWFAAGWGWFLWQSFHVETDVLTEEARMIYRGGARVTPAPLIVPLPGDTPMPTTQPPGIAVDSFGTSVSPSGVWSSTIHDRNGSGFQSVTVAIEKQRLTWRAKNAAGEDVTGMVRIVEVKA